MVEEHYKNREIDGFFNELTSKIDTNHKHIDSRLSEIEGKLDYTNGKVNRNRMLIIITFAFVIGLLVGVGILSVSDVIGIAA